MSCLQHLRILETHQLPGRLGRFAGDAGLVAVGLIAWWSLPLHEAGSVALGAGALSLLLASVLLVTGRNARLVRGARLVPEETDHEAEPSAAPSAV